MEQLMCICIISGYFNPIHPGHISLINSVKKQHPSCKLIAIVNNDKQVLLKSSVPFMDDLTRCFIVYNIKAIDEVFLSIDTDSTVIESIKAIKVDIRHKDNKIFFCNGGDRQPHSSTVPEIEFCEANNITLEYGFGDEKKYSSSTLIKNASEWINRNRFWRNFADDLLSELGVKRD
jgi:cytidyltransferase-like protein